MPETDRAAIHSLASGLQSLMEAVTVILDAVDGYKAECVRRGHTDEAAADMAREYHTYLLAQMTSACRS